MKTITFDQAHEYFDYLDGKIFWKKLPRANHTRVGDEAGSTESLGYRVVRVLGRVYRAHQIIFLMHHGRFPMEVDHIDGNPGNNRIDNLREVTRSQNMANRKMSINNSSGVKGVYWHRITGKWQARFKKDGKTIYVGLFDDIGDAADAIKSSRVAHHGEYARHEATV
jgi:hypothetical protein